MSRTASAIQNGTEEVKDEPGLQSVERATVTAGVEEAAGVRPLGAGGELGAGEQRGDGPAVRQGVHVRVGEVGAVVGARGVEFDGELDAGAVRELVGVDTRVQARRLARREDRAGLVTVEGALLAEDVDPTGVRGTGVEHVAGDEGYVRRRVVGVVGGHDVRAHVRDLVRVPGRDAQGAGLVVDGEAVAGLGLEGGGALAEGLGEVTGEVALQFRVARRARRGHRRTDTARAVGPSRHTGVELLRAVAREDQVRVGVDEARDHRPAARVDPIVSGGCFP